MTDNLRANFPPDCFLEDGWPRFMEAIKPLRLSRAHRKQAGRYYRDQTGRPLTRDQWRELVPEEGPKPWPNWVLLSYPQEPEPPEPPESITNPPPPPTARPQN